MQTLIIIWQPNDRWHALSENGKKEYLNKLDGAYDIGLE